MARQSKWREAAKPIIARVLRDNAGKTEKEIRASLLAAYPFGERAMLPYTTWNDEINRQMGKKPKLGTRKDTVNPKQMKLL